MRPFRLRSALFLALGATLAMAVRADVKSSGPDGFLIVHSRRVDAAPSDVYAAIPAIGHWWSSDHTYSGDAANMSLKAEAGSCFCERWRDGEVEHGRTLMVIRDRVFRLQESLGPRQGRAVNGVLSFELKAAEGSGGKATLLTLTYVVNGASGSALDKSAPGVDGVLREQFDRLVRYIETGKPASP
jgi:uncharacterized protein YndB with AHSA1/START domain